MDEKKNEAIESAQGSESNGGRIYEVGFHIVPMVAEENLGEEISFIRDAITKLDGRVILEGSPSKMHLAYAIDAELGGERKTFDTSYFGWVKFELPGEKINDFKKAIESKENILRHLIVKTVREDTFVPRASAMEGGEESGPAREASVAIAEEPKELTEDDKRAIDQSIDELISEDND